MDPSQIWPGPEEGHMDELESRIGEQVEVVVSSMRSSYIGTLTRVDDQGLLLRVSVGDKRSEAYHFYPWYSVLFVSFPVDLPK
jgi:translation initiation factor 6 (eIF-6)